MFTKQALRAVFEPARGGSGRLQRLKRGAGAPLVRFSVFFCASLTVGVLLFMIGYILVKGVQYLSPARLELEVQFTLWNMQKKETDL